MKLCDRCKVLGCCLNYLGPACYAARQQECPEIVPTRAEVFCNLDTTNMAMKLTHLPKDATLIDIIEWLETEEEVDV